MTAGIDLGNIADLSLEDLAALQAMIREQKKQIVDAQNAVYADMLHTFVSDVVNSREREESEKSAWAGFKVYAVPVTVDGTELSVSVTITDIARKKEREPLFSKKETADA